VVWIDSDHVISGDWQGNVILWARQSSGGFAAARNGSTGGQVLQIAISPDRSTFVARAADASRNQGFVFLALE
jgi:hypothetical protein